MTVTQPRSPALSGETVSGAFPRVEVEEEGFAEEPISQFVLLLPAAPLLLRPGVAHPAAPGVGASSSPPSLLRALGSGREAARSPWLRPFFWTRVAWARGCPPREGFAAAAAPARQCSRKTAGSTMMKMMMTMIGGPTIGGRCPVMMSDPLSGRCPMGGRAGHHHHHHQDPDHQSSAS